MNVSEAYCEASFIRDCCCFIEMKPKKADITGLQIADLIAYPITRHILDPEAVNFPYDVICPNIYEENGKLLGVKIMP